MATRNPSDYDGTTSSGKGESSPDQRPTSGDGQSAPGGNPPAPKPESPLESAYLDRSVFDLPTPSWNVPKTNEELKLFLGQCMDLLKHVNMVNPNVKSIPDLMNYQESLEIALHDARLKLAKNLEYELTDPQFEGFISGTGQDFVRNTEPLLDGIWSRKGLHLLASPPGFGKTLTIFHLMQRLNISGEAILYAGMDETEESVIDKLLSLGYENWQISRLPEGLAGDLAWGAINQWEVYTKEHTRRFLILDLLMHYCPMEINSPGSIIRELSKVINFANKNNIVVVGLCHSSLGSIAPTGHQSLWGCSQRLLILKETEDNNTVEIDVTRRGPNKTLRFTHDWIDINKAKELLERGKVVVSSGPKNKNKLEQAMDWIKQHSEYTGISVRLLADTAKHHHKDPLELGKTTWAEALKEINKNVGIDDNEQETLEYP